MVIPNYEFLVCALKNQRITSINIIIIIIINIKLNLIKSCNKTCKIHSLNKTNHWISTEDLFTQIWTDRLTQTCRVAEKKIEKKEEKKKATLFYLSIGQKKIFLFLHRKFWLLPMKKNHHKNFDFKVFWSNYSIFLS